MTIDATPNPDSEVPASELTVGDTFALGSPDGARVVVVLVDFDRVVARRVDGTRGAELTYTVLDALGVFAVVRGDRA